MNPERDTAKKPFAPTDTKLTGRQLAPRRIDGSGAIKRALLGPRKLRPVAGVNANFGAPTPFNFQPTVADARIGWTLGTGPQWAFADSWSALRARRDRLDYIIAP
jgi:hypothetical protein